MTSLSETSMLAGSSGVTSGYTIDQSIRFNDDDSAWEQISICLEVVQMLIILLT